MFWLMLWRIFSILAALDSARAADHRLLLCAAASKGYVVGAKLPPSGLFALVGEVWEHLGYTHPYITSVDYDRHDPSLLYMAAGNGCIRSADQGRSWQILTSWDMTELQDVTVDPHHRGALFVALPDGIAHTTNSGQTWQRAEQGLRRKFTKAIRVDPKHPGHLIAGGESGIYSSADDGAHWKLAESAATMITDIEQSHHRPAEWLATSQSNGAIRSTDGGHHWRPVETLPSSGTLYRISYDPLDPSRLAICGWGPGVLVSEDAGRTFVARNAGLPSPNVWSVRFDPDHPGRLYAAVHEEAVFVSDDSGRNWRRFGMEGTIVYNMVFVPNVHRREVRP